MYDFNNDIKQVLKKYELLKYYPHDKCLNGDIELISESGKFIDIFNVVIKIPEGFPRCFPKVLETEEKIPRSKMRHVMPYTNILCLAVPIEEYLVCSNGITILWFIDNVLVPRLCEEFRVNNGENYQREYSHDFGGIWEFLMKKLETKNIDHVLIFMKVLATKKTPKGNSPCLCGSNKPFRLCHKKTIASLQHLKNDILNLVYNSLLENPYKGINL